MFASLSSPLFLSFYGANYVSKQLGTRRSFPARDLYTHPEYPPERFRHPTEESFHSHEHPTLGFHPSPQKSKFWINRCSPQS